MPSPQSKFFLGTDNLTPMLTSGNGDDARAYYENVFVPHADALVKNGTAVAFCGQLEIAPNPAEGRNGFHVQFYVVLKTRVTITGAIQALDIGHPIHLDICTETNRSLERVREYCNDDSKASKDSATAMFSFGSFPSGKPGAMNVQELLLDLTNKRSYEDIVKSCITNEAMFNTISKHQRLIKDFCMLTTQPRGTDFTPRIIICIGEPGTGKSCFVQHGLLDYIKDQFKETYTINDIYDWQGDSGGSSTWVTPDAAGKLIWIQHEAKGQHCTPDAQKTLWDRGGARIQTKGGFIECMAKYWVITSNFDFEQWWPKLKLHAPDVWERHMQAIRRRITEFGVYPNYKAFTRDFIRRQRLEKRLAEQGGLRIIGPARRITPEPVFEQENLPDSQ